MSEPPAFDLAHCEWFTRSFPDADTLTLAEYRAARANPQPPTVAPATRYTCDVCGRRFIRGPFTSQQRFCSRQCMRRYHYPATRRSRQASDSGAES